MGRSEALSCVYFSAQLCTDALMRLFKNTLWSRVQVAEQERKWGLRRGIRAGAKADTSSAASPRSRQVRGLEWRRCWRQSQHSRLGP